MTRWYRAYEGTVTDAKIGEAALIANCSRSVAIASWHCILESCASAQNGGQFDTTPRRVSVILGEQPDIIGRVFEAFTELEMICNGSVTAWKQRQFESDTSTERSRKFRERQRNGDATLQGRAATPPDTDTDTDTEDKKVSCETGVPNEEKLAFEAYNDLAVEVGIPKAQVLTDGRRTKIRQRLNECGGLTGWLDAMGKIRGSPFLRGDNKSGWKADLDFVLQKSSFTRLLEGSYDRQTGNRATAGQHRNSIANGFAILDAVTDEAIRRAGGLGQEGSQEDPWSIPGLRQGTA